MLVNFIKKKELLIKLFFYFLKIKKFFYFSINYKF